MEVEYAIHRHIGGQLPTRGADAVIAALAGGQHGVVSRRQLLALGIGSDAVDGRLARGLLHPLHRGVYSVGHQVVTREGRWLAAVLSAGPGAVLSHRSAAALWRIRQTASARIEVTVPRQLKPRKNLLPHRAVLPEDEHTTKDGIPVTTPARTLLDLAAVLKSNELDRALDEAERQRLHGPNALIARYPRAKGTRALRTLLLNVRRSLRSPLEADFLTFIRANGLPEPETNTLIEGYECDAVYREAKLVIELDGYQTHGTRASFEHDRARDLRLTAKGWRSVRITDRQLKRPAALAQELLSSLRA